MDILSITLALLSIIIVGPGLTYLYLAVLESRKNSELTRTNLLTLADEVAKMKSKTPDQQKLQELENKVSALMLRPR